MNVMRSMIEFDNQSCTMCNFRAESHFTITDDVQQSFAKGLFCTSFGTVGAFP